MTLKEKYMLYLKPILHCALSPPLSLSSPLAVFAYIAFALISCDADIHGFCSYVKYRIHMLDTVYDIYPSGTKNWRLS